MEKFIDVLSKNVIDRLGFGDLDRGEDTYLVKNYPTKSHPTASLGKILMFIKEWLKTVNRLT